MKRIKITMTCFVLCFLLMACGSSGKYKTGTFEGSGRGHSKEDPIKLSVTIDESGSIYEIKILDHAETEEIGGKALRTLADEAKRKNSADVDTVSGATRTSEGFRQALKEALGRAKEK